MKEIKDLVKILTIENEDDMCNFEFKMHGHKQVILRRFDWGAFVNHFIFSRRRKRTTEPV